jgi:DNA repair protein RadC
MFDSMIADLPLEDRPRERMHRHGVRTMSDADLLAILLGSGTEGKNAIE